MDRQLRRYWVQQRSYLEYLLSNASSGRERAGYERQLQEVERQIARLQENEPTDTTK